MPSGRQALGKRGENLAANWYVSNGYEVIARNWRIRTAELDLVVRRGAELVFCEVKTRVDDRFGSPAESVTPAKQAKVRTAALAFLGQWNGERMELRFDVACVVGSDVEVIQAAF